MLRDTNDLMDSISASLVTTLDKIYQHMLECNIGLEDPDLPMFTVALLNAMGREGRGEHPTEEVLMLAFGEFNTP